MSKILFFVFFLVGFGGMVLYFMSATGGDPEPAFIALAAFGYIGMALIILNWYLNQRDGE